MQALARDDVQRFLPLSEQAALRNWDREMFLYHVEVLHAISKSWKSNV